LDEEMDRIVKGVGNSEIFRDPKTNSDFSGREMDVNEK
jgi:hypothetical protein